MAASMVGALPSWVWARLPARAAVGLRSFARRHADARLPVVAVGDLANASLPRRWSGTPKAELLRAYSGYTANGTLSPMNKSRGAGAPAAGGQQAQAPVDLTGRPAALTGGVKDNAALSPLAHARPD